MTSFIMTEGGAMQLPAVVRPKACRECGEHDLSHGGVDIAGHPFCEWCFDKLDLDEKFVGQELREAMLEMYGADAFDSAYEAREFRE